MSLYDAETRRLVETRIAAYASAFDALDIEAVKAWHSKDIVFNDTGKLARLLLQQVPCGQ